MGLVLVALGAALILYICWEDRGEDNRLYDDGFDPTPYTGPLYNRHGREIEPPKIRSVA